MARKRDHYRYELKDGNKIVYIGITDDPSRREAQHRQEGKRFSHMRVVGLAVTIDTAQKWEKERLETYRKSHSGKNPRYNRTNE